MILTKLQWKNPKTKNIFGFVKDRSTLDAIVYLATKITARKCPPKKQTRVCRLHGSGQGIRVRWSSFHAVLPYLHGYIWEDHHMYRGLSIKQKDNGKDSRNHLDPHDLTTGYSHGSTISPTIFNGFIAQLLTVTLPPSVDILAYAVDLVLISHGNSPAVKLQKALNAVDKAANSLGLYFSSAKTKTMAFNTTR